MTRDELRDSALGAIIDSVNEIKESFIVGYGEVSSESIKILGVKLDEIENLAQQALNAEDE